jgi:hypothetical protein
MPFLVLHIVCSLLLDLLHVLTRADHDKDLELLLLRQLRAPGAAAAALALREGAPGQRGRQAGRPLARLPGLHAGDPAALAVGCGNYIRRWKRGYAASR